MTLKKTGLLVLYTIGAMVAGAAIADETGLFSFSNTQILSNTDTVSIMHDKQTGCQYIQRAGQGAIALTPRLSKQGTPMGCGEN